ncbi:MAG: hypothetical protein RI573_06440, partial [Balneolaceae bacterium]|nr:hypothetical protein [Balneolaceae bacterium]
DHSRGSAKKKCMNFITGGMKAGAWERFIVVEKGHKWTLSPVEEKFTIGELFVRSVLNRGRGKLFR